MNPRQDILFDPQNQTIQIFDGSIGTYTYKDIIKNQILYEHAPYKGKSKMFSHRVLISTFNNSLFIEMKKVYIGIEIKLLNKDPVYVYISKEPVIQHNQQFKEDLKRAKQIVQKLKKIAQKNQESHSTS